MQLMATMSRLPSPDQHAQLTDALLTLSLLTNNVCLSAVNCYYYYYYYYYYY